MSDDALIQHYIASVKALYDYEIPATEVMVTDEEAEAFQRNWGEPNAHADTPQGLKIIAWRNFKPNPNLDRPINIFVGDNGEKRLVHMG